MKLSLSAILQKVVLACISQSVIAAGNNDQIELEVMHNPQHLKIHESIEKPNKIFDVDYNLKIDENLENDLESKCLEKSKSWILNLENSIQFEDQDKIIKNWPFFLDTKYKDIELGRCYINELIKFHLGIKEKFAEHEKFNLLSYLLYTSYFQQFA